MTYLVSSGTLTFNPISQSLSYELKVFVSTKFYCHFFWWWQLRISGL